MNETRPPDYGYGPLPVVQGQITHLWDELCEAKRAIAKLEAENAALRLAVACKIDDVAVENARLRRHVAMYDKGGCFTLRKLCEALGWQGGKLHQVLAEVRRLRAKEGA